jgi:hypothetical protein
MTLAIEPLVIVPDEDESDRVWLERQLNTFRDGMQTAAVAALEIARNWADGRQVGRLYPEYTLYSFMEEFFGTIRLPREERNHFLVKLVESGLSQRKAAKLAGVSAMTASRGVTNVTARKPRKPRAEPGTTTLIAREVKGILGPRSTLPDEFERWLPTANLNERLLVAVAFEDLAQRALGWAKKARSGNE